MKESELHRLRKLRDAYNHSQGICDPIEYLNRQKNLLSTFVKITLEQLEEHEYLLSKRTLASSSPVKITIEQLEEHEYLLSTTTLGSSSSRSTSDKDTHQP